MFSVNQPFSPTAKAGLEAQLALFTTLSQMVIENTEKIIDFNVSAARANLEKSATSTKQLLSSRDPQEGFSLMAARAGENIETAFAYTRQMAGILSATRSEFTKEIDARTAEAKRQMNILVDQMAVKAPASAETSITLMKSVINNASAGYEQWTRMMREAVAAVENQMAAATEQLSEAAAKKLNGQSVKK
jgi:phasin family protein